MLSVGISSANFTGGAILHAADETITISGHKTWIHGDNPENQRPTSINVIKTWNDTNDHDGLRPGSVTVKLFADGIDTGKAITLMDKNNWSGEFEDLVEKKDGKRIIYTVEEVPVPDYTSSCEPQVDDEGETAGYTITNTHTPVTRGSLVVSKTVAGNAASKDKEFSFTVTLKDTSINGTYTDMNFVNGVATFTLKDGESKTATGLPNGTAYTVSESDYTADGYVTTKTGDEGIIVGDDTLTAAFTNTRNGSHSPKTGDNSKFVLWFLLLVLSSFGLVGSGSTFRRKKRR